MRADHTDWLSYPAGWYLKMPLFDLNYLHILAILASKRYENYLSNAGKGFFLVFYDKNLTRFGDGGSILVIWSRFSKIDKSGAGGAPMIGFAITVYPRGIGLAIKIFDLLSSDGNGPEKG